jgi:hypothetical protein
VKHDIDLIIIMRRPNLPEREEICRRGNMSERERERENLPERDTRWRRWLIAEREAGDVTDRTWNCTVEKFKRERGGAALEGKWYFSFPSNRFSSKRKKNGKKKILKSLSTSACYAVVMKKVCKYHFSFKKQESKD